MLYVSGIYALNLRCNLETCGDWHQSSMRWENLKLKESIGSLFGDYGLEPDRFIPMHSERFAVANTIRALLDLLVDGDYATAQGMNNDFICNEKYDNEVFNMVLRMKCLPNWREINQFMGKEYKIKWLRFLEAHNEQFC